MNCELEAIMHFGIEKYSRGLAAGRKGVKNHSTKSFSRQHFNLMYQFVSAIEQYLDSNSSQITSPLWLLANAN